MKFNFKSVKDPLVDTLAITVGAIAGNQFLDFGKMFKTADPEGFVIKHQGGIKAGAVILGVGLFGKKMPHIVKMALIGVGVAGGIKEVKELSKGKIESIGADNGGSDTSTLDRLLEEARLSGGMGAIDTSAGVGAIDTDAGVGYTNPDIPNMDYGSSVGWT